MFPNRLPRDLRKTMFPEKLPNVSESLSSRFKKGRMFPNRLPRDLRKRKENEMKRNDNESKFKAMYLNLQFHRKSRGRRFGNVRPLIRKHFTFPNRLNRDL